MKLKEMANTAVIITTENEFEEYKSIMVAGGWSFTANKNWLEEENYDFYLGVGKGMWWGNVSKPSEGLKLITLAEFKKEQGIMKYSEGDVLVIPAKNYEFKILAVCGLLYGCSELGDFDTFDEWNTESDLDACRLKTETTKTDMSVSEIEKALGKAAGSLNVVAE